MILIFGYEDDIFAYRTYNLLHNEGYEVSFIEGSSLLKNVCFNYSLACTYGDSFLLVNTHKVYLKDISNVLVRLKLPLTTDSDMNQEDQLYSRYELEATWKALLKLLEDRVINCQSANIDNNFSSVYTNVAQAITECGFKIPKICVTSKFQNAAQFYENCSHRAIFSYAAKQIAGQLLEGKDKLTYIQEVTEQHLIRLQEAPQGLWFDVYTVGNKVFASLIDIVCTGEETKRIYIPPVEFAPELQERCLKLARTLQLDFAQFKLWQTHQGDCYCFDINSFPNSELCNEKMAEDITEALVQIVKINQTKNQKELVS